MRRLPPHYAQTSGRATLAPSRGTDSPLRLDVGDMTFLVLGLAVLLVLVAVGRGWVGTDPRKLSKGMRTTGGLLAIAAGVYFSALGREILGLPLIVIGGSLLGRDVLGTFWPGRGQARPGPSQLRSSHLEMMLDPRAGTLVGRVVAGRFAGRALDGLSPAEFEMLASELATADPQGSKLLKAYLDRRRAGGGENLHGDPGGGRRQAAGQTAMTEQQAYEVLGLEAGAGAEEVRRAYRALMKKLHPDQGGSTYLAAQVNAAKDLLLRKHG